VSMESLADNAGRVWLEEARSVMHVSEEHDRRCERACLDCLLTYDAQEAIGDGTLNRRPALAALSALLDGNEVPACPLPPVAIVSDEPVKPSNEERLQASVERLAGRGKRGRRRGG